VKDGLLCIKQRIISLRTNQFQTIVPIASSNDSTACDESARSDLEMNLMPSFSAFAVLASVRPDGNSQKTEFLERFQPVTFSLLLNFFFSSFQLRNENEKETFYRVELYELHGLERVQYDHANYNEMRMEFSTRRRGGFLRNQPPKSQAK
jgi:hypothetical protein